MTNPKRRTVIQAGLTLAALPNAILLSGCASEESTTSPADESSPDDRSTLDAESSEPNAKEWNATQVHYLEIVTNEVDAVCATYSQLHGAKFSNVDQNLGGARTAVFAYGGMLGVRTPLRDTEEPVVRPYLLVEDIQAAVDAAAKAGAKVAVPPMELPGHGTCAIIIQGGVESGMWQL